MIRCLIIGNKDDSDYYFNLISQSKYFVTPETYVLASDTRPFNKLDLLQYNALFFVSDNLTNFEIIKKGIKAQQNIYFVDQPSFTLKEIQELEQLYLEANNLLIPELTELHHPLLEDFITTNSHHLLFRYSKNISSAEMIRPVLVSALSILSQISPMQIKNINVIQEPESNKPNIKIRLKMYDSSVAYIILNFEKQQNHNILLELRNGSYLFNLNENYLENIYGNRFTSPLKTEKQLKKISIEKFALLIIVNKKPQFTFSHYSLTIKSLINIENILANTF